MIIFMQLFPRSKMRSPTCSSLSKKSKSLDLIHATIQVQIVRTQLHISRVRTKSHSSSDKRESKAIHSTPTFLLQSLFRSSWLTGRRTQKHMHRATFCRLQHQQPQIRLNLTIRPNSRRRSPSSSRKSRASWPRCSTPPMTSERNLDQLSIYRRAIIYF